MIIIIEQIIYRSREEKHGSRLDYDIYVYVLFQSFSPTIRIHRSRDLQNENQRRVFGMPLLFPLSFIVLIVLYCITLNLLFSLLRVGRLFLSEIYSEVGSWCWGYQPPPFNGLFTNYPSRTYSTIYISLLSFILFSSLSSLSCSAFLMFYT